MDVQYFGWSGVAIRHAGALVGFDLFGEAVTWTIAEEATTTILCLTHGHPEHCGSLRSFLTTADASPHLATTHLISSPPVVKHVAGGGVLPPDQVHSLQDAGRVSIADVQVTAFAWRHFPLLPPGLRPKVEYVTRLLMRPTSLVRIGFSSFGLPVRAPTLGFHLTFADGCTVLNYAEGLHRFTDPDEVEAVAKASPAEVLVFAVEPEDVEVIPRWLEVLRPSAVYLYEAHRPWRELFRLPYVDLDAYARALSARFPETHCTALIRAGQVVGFSRV